MLKPTGFKPETRLTSSQRVNKAFIDFDIQLGDKIKNNSNLF